MNEEQYRSLCASCDQVLAEPGSPIERIAIPWLHVLSEHPAVLRHYAGIFENHTRRWPIRLKSALSQIAGAVGDIGSGRARHRGQERADIMFVSHLLNVGQVGGREDFYFGRLPEDVRKEGMSSSVVLINHAGLKRGDGSDWAGDMAPRRVLERRLSARGELALRRRLAGEARRLRGRDRRQGDGLQHRVRLEAARQALSGSALDTLRIYEQLRAALTVVRPKAVVATYEGHAWERLLFAAARQILPDCRCIGYHHTILFPRQHAVFRLLGPRYDPDVVLTAGDVARDRFRSAVTAAGIRISTLGTHRRSTGGSAVTHEPSSARPLACLVLPDGIMSEVLYLFDFAVAAAALMPEVRFILRLHPLISRAALKRSFPRFRQLPSNVELSSQTLGDDFSRSRWALYRGSGAAVQAVLAGVRPVYVARPGELSIDCLSGLQAWKRIVSAPEEFVKIGTCDLHGDGTNSFHEAAAATEYCGKYFMPVDPPALLRIVAETPVLER
jgi:hypothetical protein